MNEQTELQIEGRSRLDEAIQDLQWIVNHPMAFTPRLLSTDLNWLAQACGLAMDARRSMNTYLKESS